jgi:hypothetical protein
MYIIFLPISLSAVRRRFNSSIEPIEWRCGSLVLSDMRDSVNKRYLLVCAFFASASILVPIYGISKSVTSMYDIFFISIIVVLGYVLSLDGVGVLLSGR